MPRKTVHETPPIRTDADAKLTMFRFQTCFSQNFHTEHDLKPT